MKTLLIILLALLTMNTAKAQEKKPSLQVFKNLVGGTWKGEGTWSDGSPFKLDLEYEWGLSGNLVKSKTFGNISNDGYEFGLRNEGIRVWSEEVPGIVFWEFDIFGGITEGTVMVDGHDIYYHYLYDFGQGPVELTDGWIFKDKNTYEFLVGEYKNGEWKQKYLSTTMKRNY